MKKDRLLVYISIIVSALFTYFIWLFGKEGFEIDYAPDTGYLHYFWKLPEPDTMARITAWGGYILHQVLSWYVFFLAQKNRKPFDNKLNKYNWWMLGVQVFFVIFHFIQTHVWYDALAQDTSILLSQGSVIIMLVLSLIMLNYQRGIFFGKKARFPANVIKYLMKNHGYYILWATIFTFWYHPMEAEISHLLGFFYMFLLFIQAITLYTEMHLNKWWMFALEFFVLIHGTLVAIDTGNGMWPMFAFGFGFMAIAAQVYMLPINKSTRIALQLGYVALMIFVYTGGLNSGRSLGDLVEVLYIPIIDYVLIVVLVALISLALAIWSKVSSVNKK